MIEFISQLWPWYVSGPLITLTMAILLFSGRRFGISSNLQTLCAMGGCGKVADYFKIDWKKNVWNLVFVSGTIIGGFLASAYLASDAPVDLNPATVESLAEYGITPQTNEALPTGLFSWGNLGTPQGLIMLLLGGFLVGFGVRYANGCTSGHAISGLSNLQLPSLIAVIGFFTGGLIMTWLILPHLLNL